MYRRPYSLEIHVRSGILTYKVEEHTELKIYLTESESDIISSVVVCCLYLFEGKGC